MKRTLTPDAAALPIYTSAGRICHAFMVNGYCMQGVTDDFGNSAPMDVAQVLFFVRGAESSYQPEY